MSMTLATHDGTFHADDVMAYAILSIAFPGADLVRTRDPGTLAAADLAFDVGGAYDPERLLYDHHMADGPVREDGTPYSSVGLVWRHHGHDCLAMAFPNEPEWLLERVWSDLDGGLVSEIDRLDNGVGDIGHGGFPALVDDFNPRWDEDRNPNRAFLDAAEMASSVFRRRCAAAIAAARAWNAVTEAASKAQDPRIVFLERGMPWEAAILDGFPEALYVVYPSKSGGWQCAAVPPVRGSFAQRKPLPAAWAGLRGRELSDATGVDGAVFCHHARFVCGAETAAAALALANAAADWPEHAPSP